MKNNNTSSSVNRIDIGDGLLKHIYKCGSKRCQFQHKFIPQNNIISTVTNRIYECVVPSGSTYINCHSTNVVYLITCSNCSLQYVGETINKLNERFNKHDSAFSNNKTTAFCVILTNHFNSGKCKGAKYTVNILEKLDGSGRTERRAMDPESTAYRKQREIYWMLKLRTVYPYGLNDRIGDEYKSHDTHIIVGKRFPPLKRTFPRENRGSLRKGNHSLTPNMFYDNLQNMFHRDIKKVPNFIRTSLTNMKKSSLRSIHEKLNMELNNKPSDFDFTQYYLLALDIIETKLYTKPPSIKKKPAPENVCTIFFDNKGIELINLPRILHDKSLQQFLPSNDVFPIPMVTYKLPDSISSTIFNYQQFVSKLDLDNLLRDPNYLPCDCANSPYRDKHHGHIVTGDLRIIKNNKLRKVFSKGPKYRENQPINFETSKDYILTGLDDCLDNWCNRNGVNKTIYSEWYHNITKAIEKRIQELKKNIKHHSVSDNLSTKEMTSALKNLHDKFVICPIDKAAGNVAVICKKFYAIILMKELGLIDNTLSSTYVTVNEKTAEEIINKNVSDLKRKFNINKVDKDHLRLPQMHWIPKLHKSPIKARFIVASPKCSVKSLSKDVTSVFKLFYKQIEAYNLKSRYFSGVNTFWVVQNNKPLAQSIDKLNKRNKARSITTFDFSTLYTKIPHSKLVSVLHSLIDFCFNGGDKKYIGINRYGARWVKDPNKYPAYFDKKMIKEAVSYLLDNCFFTVGNKLFKQIIGIPMGSDPAPFFANLFLYFYERKFMLNLQKKDLHRARKYGNVFRFIDDLSAINDSNEFENNHKQIYPEELLLNKENTSNSQASFLDIDVTINNNKFVTSLYDKRNAFPFSIVKMPHKCSNIPSNIFYAAIGAEILRIARACSDSNGFSISVKPLVNRMLKQGANMNKIINVLKRFFNKHKTDFSYISQSSAAFINVVFRD